MFSMKRTIGILVLAVLLLSAAAATGEETFEIIGRGSQGERVVRIQERLFDLGYYFYKPTGSFQTVTRASLMNYQAESGLISDGTVGEESYRALFGRDAKRNPFRAAVSLGYTAQGAMQMRGVAQRWEVVRTQLVEGEAYTVTNAATRESCTLLYQGGENHAEFALRQGWNGYDAAAVRMLTSWLGASNSFYKCGVVLDVGGQNVAASIQWNGEGHVCLYMTGSTSHVFSLPDPDHEAMILRVAGY